MKNQDEVVVTRQVKLNIVVAGAANTGKTGLVGVLNDSDFFKKNSEYNPTVSTDFSSKSYVHDGVRYVCQLWDTSGQEKDTGAVTVKGCEQVNAFIVTVDLTEISSLEYAKNKIALLEECYKDVPILLTGTKSDLTCKEGVKNAIREFNIDNKYNYVETSAKTNTNVVERFENARALAAKHNQTLIEEQPQKRNEVDLESEHNKQHRFLNLNQSPSRGKRFAIGLGISLIVIAGLFALVATAYLLLPAAAGAFMVGIGLAIAKLFSITVLTTTLSSASASVIAITLGAIAATGVAAIALIANVINGVRHIYGSAADEHKFLKNKDFCVYDSSVGGNTTSFHKISQSLGSGVQGNELPPPSTTLSSCWDGHKVPKNPLHTDDEKSQFQKKLI